MGMISIIYIKEKIRTTENESNPCLWKCMELHTVFKGKKWRLVDYILVLQVNSYEETLREARDEAQWWLYFSECSAVKRSKTSSGWCAHINTHIKHCDYRPSAWACSAHLPQHPCPSVCGFSINLSWLWVPAVSCQCMRLHYFLSSSGHLLNSQPLMWVHLGPCAVIKLKGCFLKRWTFDPEE